MADEVSDSLAKCFTAYYAMHRESGPLSTRINIIHGMQRALSMQIAQLASDLGKDASPSLFASDITLQALISSILRA